MWRKEDGNPQASPEAPASAVNSVATPKILGGGNISSGSVLSPRAVACISQGIRIKGELHGTEDLFVDGHVDGKISLGNATLTVGPNAIVRAEMAARDLVVRGHVEGKLTANERIQVWSTARIEGDMKADRISIEEGAELHGRLEAGKLSVVAASSGIGGAALRAEANKTMDASGGEGKSAPGAAVAGAN